MTERMTSALDPEAASEPVNLREKLDGFTEHWSPRIVATLNDYDVMVVRVEGEFVWHAHPETDDFFLVLEGELDIDLRDRTVRCGRESSSWCRKASSTGRPLGGER